MKSLNIFLLLILGSMPAAHAVTNAMIKTNMGEIRLELYEAKAPITVKNFLEYAAAGFYNDTIFHRVIKGFMIQGGGLTADMQEKLTRDPIQNEAKNGLKNKKYTIAMAREEAPHTATAQFFINVNDNAWLDQPAGEGWGYAVFGRVTSGTEIVDQIQAVRTGEKLGYEDVPLDPIIVESVTVGN